MIEAKSINKRVAKKIETENFDQSGVPIAYFTWWNPLVLLVCKHTGFWQCMDTVRERETLEELWAAGQAPWKVWAD